MTHRPVNTAVFKRLFGGKTTAALLTNGNVADDNRSPVKAPAIDDVLTTPASDSLLEASTIVVVGAAAAATEENPGFAAAAAGDETAPELVRATAIAGDGIVEV